MTTLCQQVLLFGNARLLSGRRDVELAVQPRVAIGGLVAALAEACPQLVGQALKEDLSGLMESYLFNLNGKEFVHGDELSLEQGDELLLFSSMSGG